jgi:serine/threonine protein kinase
MKAIGKYEVIDELGAGAAGTTYRVRDTAGSRELALKVLSCATTLSEEAREQFRRDLGGYADFRHPHIAKIQEIGEADGGIYVVTELFNGIDLDRHLEERRVLPLEQRLEFIAQVCDALALPHSKGIAHGNLKPSNIFVVAGKNARLLDFGTGKWLEKILAAGAKLPGLLPNYLAPEQVLGQPFDPKSDVFSVGLMLYELVAGRYPFQVAANLIPREIVHSDPESLRSLDAQIPEQLDRLVTRALAKNPQERLPSTAEFAAGLNDIAQKLRDVRTPLAPPVAVPPSTPSLARPTVAPPEPKPAPPPAPSAAPPPAPSAAPPAAPPAPPASTPPVVIATPPPAPRAPMPPAPPTPALAAIRTASKAGPRKPVASTKLDLRKRLIVYAAAGVIAVALIAMMFSRQNSMASPNRAGAPSGQPVVLSAPGVPPMSPATAIGEPVQAGQPAALPQQATPPPAAPPAAEVKVTPEQILRGQVRKLWESGRYAQAMELVDAVLASNPNHAEARAWKKKIRAAQDAEAAIK